MTKILARPLVLASIGFAAFAAVACAPTPAAAPSKPPDTLEVTVLSRPSGGGGSGPEIAAPSSSTDPAANTPATPTASADDVTPTELKTKEPGTYTVSAYVVRITSCPPCSPPKVCKPCATPAVFISAQIPPGGKDPDDTIDLLVADPSQYQPGAHYQFVVTVAAASGNGTPTRHIFSAKAQ